MKVLTNDDFSKLFLKHGFDKTEINNNLSYQKNRVFYKISYIKDMNGYMIETADSKQDAINNLYEDSEFIKNNKEDIVKLEIEKFLKNN